MIWIAFVQTDFSILCTFQDQKLFLIKLSLDHWFSESLL